MRNIVKNLLIFLFFILTSAAYAADATRSITVMLDWYVNPNHAPLIIADIERFFQQEGLQVKFIVPTDANSGEKMVALGKADIAITYGAALTYHASILPIVYFATLINAPLNCFIMLQDGKINSLADVRGKRIGYSGAEIDKIIFATMLKKVNLILGDVDLINVKFNLVSALLTKKIDGFLGGMRNFEPLVIESMGGKIRVFYPEEYGFPKYSELILVINKNRTKDPDLIKFTRALKKGVQYLKKNPTKSWQKFILRYPDQNNPVNKKVWLLTINYFAL